VFWRAFAHAFVNHTACRSGTGEIICANDLIAAIPSSFNAFFDVGAKIMGYKSAASIFSLKFF